jgi:hypothetical protein
MRVFEQDEQSRARDRADENPKRDLPGQRMKPTGQSDESIHGGYQLSRDADHKHDSECNQDLFHSARSAALGFSRLSD